MKTEHIPVETTPVIVDGIMYATEPPNKILALDAGTGQLLWSYNHLGSLVSDGMSPQSSAAL